MAKRRPKMSRFGMPLICDICGLVREKGECRPFSLVANYLQESGKRTTRSFGSLDVCKWCWASKASDNRRDGNGEDPFKQAGS
jgi:hypothetical protein